MKTTYTIEEINRAWIRFNSPTYIIKGKCDQVRKKGDFLFTTNEYLMNFPEYLSCVKPKDFLSYLVDFYDKEGINGSK